VPKFLQSAVRALAPARRHPPDPVALARGLPGDVLEALSQLSEALGSGATLDARPAEVCQQRLLSAFLSVRQRWLAPAAEPALEEASGLGPRPEALAVREAAQIEAAQAAASEAAFLASLQAARALASEDAVPALEAAMLTLGMAAPAPEEAPQAVEVQATEEVRKEAERAVEAGAPRAEMAAPAVDGAVERARRALEVPQTDERRAQIGQSQPTGPRDPAWMPHSAAFRQAARRQVICGAWLTRVSLTEASDVVTQSVAQSHVTPSARTLQGGGCDGASNLAPIGVACCVPISIIRRGRAVARVQVCRSALDARHQVAPSLRGLRWATRSSVT